MPGSSETSSVVEFYNGGRIFVTGGTGFLGKALLEKLLRICPDVHIYALIRVKKDKNPQSRLKELFQDPIFKRLRSEKPDFEKNVTCVPGDISCLRLGMSDSDYDFVTKEITHIIHSAATVRFNENLKTAILINVLGTREVVTLGSKCNRLKVLVHVSTAFSNCLNSPVAEDFYKPPITPEGALNLIEILKEDNLNAATQELIKPWPNTYTFTKIIAESIIAENVKSMPCLMVRPGIVMGTCKEPIEGWIDNIYGPTGIIVGVGIGLLRVFLADGECEANLVPVDLTINCILCSAWKVGTSFNNNTTESSQNDSNATVEYSRKTEPTPKIYNFVADKENVLNWSEFLEKTYEFGMEVPSIKTIWYYTIMLTKIRFFYLFLIFFCHYVPGVLSDAVLLLFGKKPQVVKAYKKIHVFCNATSSFSIKTWHFSNENTKNLWRHLSDKDKELFNFDMRAIDWDTYLKDVVLGIRTFLFKESDQTLPAAKRKLFFLWLGHRLIQFFFIGLGFWIMNKLFFKFDIFHSQFPDSIFIRTGNST